MRLYTVHYFWYSIVRKLAPENAGGGALAERWTRRTWHIWRQANWGGDRCTSRKSQQWASLTWTPGSTKIRAVGPNFDRRLTPSATDWTSFLCEESILLHRLLSSLLQQVHTVGHSVTFGAEWNEMKLTLCNSCFEQLSLAWRLVSVISLACASLSLNTSNRYGGEKKWSAQGRI